MLKSEEVSQNIEQGESKLELLDKQIREAQLKSNEYRLNLNPIVLEMDAVMNNGRVKMGSLSFDLIAVKKDLKKLLAKLSKMKLGAEKLSHSLNLKESEAKALKQQVDALVNELRLKRGELLTARANLKTAEAKKISLEVKIRGLNSTISNLRSRISSVSGNLDSKKSQLFSAQSELSSARSQLTAARSRTDNQGGFNSAVSSAEGRVRSAEGRVSSLRSNVSSLEWELSGLRSSLSSAEIQLSSARSNLQATIQNIRNLKSRIQWLESEISRLETELGRMQAEFNRINRDRMEFERNLSQQASLIQSTKAFAAKLSKQIQDIENEMMKVKNECTTMLEEREKQITVLEQKLSKNIVKLGKDRSLFIEVEKELNDLKLRKQDIVQRQADLMKDFDRIGDECFQTSFEADNQNKIRSDQIKFEKEHEDIIRLDRESENWVCDSKI